MTNISINKLHEFRNHPYQVLDNEEMNSLIESVQQQGIMTPLIVRPLEDTTACGAEGRACRSSCLYSSRQP